jgi:hypothetical protein
MPTATPRSLYFSGDGLLWAARIAGDGTAMGYRAVGNVTSLVLTPTLGTTEHRRFAEHYGKVHDDIPLSIGGKLTANLESLHRENLAMLSGDHAIERVAASGEVVVTKGYTGAYTYLPHPLLSAVTSVLAGAYALTAYIDEATAYDYRADENGGMVYLNDGVTADVVGLKSYATAVTGYSAEGGYLRLTTALVMAVGDPGLLVDPGGTLGALPLAFVARAVGTGYVDTNISVSGAPALVGTPKVLGDGFPLTVTYNYAAQNVSTGLATVTRHWSFLFQGLNSVDGGLYNIRVPRAFLRAGFSQDMINPELASLPFEAALLYSPLDPDPQLFTIETLPQGFRPII